MAVKSLAKTLIICAVLSALAACSSNQTAEQSSPNNAASSPNAASSSSASSSLKSSQSAKSTKVNATVKEMAIQLSSTTVPAGLVEFVVKNTGKEPHEFVVLKNDLKGKKLPMKGDKLDEDAKGLKNMGEIETDKLKSGATETLKVNLTPGQYLIICNIKDHFKKGMKTELTVK
ncbi:MAG TPA: cupredoxin domain-containing protein [Allocoleopsis sp.]